MLIPEASVSAQLVDRTFLRVLWIELAVLVPVIMVMLAFIFKYREKKHPVPENVEGSRSLEIIWTVIPVLLVMVIFYIGLIGFDQIRDVPEKVTTIKVIGQQWSWHFSYENGRETTELLVPVKQPVKLVLTSRDVIHSFYIPAFRIKEDCVPGMENYLSFKAEQPGKYDVFCTEYCGLRHSGMVTKIVAMEGRDFNSWYAAAPEAGKKAGKKSGQTLLAEKGCLGCHTTDGKPSAGPTYKGLYGSRVTVITNGKERTLTADEAYLRSSILTPAADIAKGFPGIMPALPLQPEELETIVKYLESLK